MSDTLELLETIGRDSSLRHAPMGELTERLAQADASEALMNAVSSGDMTHLAAEFGQKPIHVTQSSQTIPGQEEKEPGDDQESEAGNPERESSKGR